MEKPAGKPRVIVSPPLRAPPALAVKVAVQVERALPLWGAPAKPGTTTAGVVAALIVTLAGLAAVVSALVATVRLPAAVMVWAGGLTTPAIVSCPLPVLANAQDAPVSVIVTVG